MVAWSPRHETASGRTHDRLDYQLIDVDRDGVKIYHRLLECDTKMRKVLFEAVWRS